MYPLKKGYAKKEQITGKLNILISKEPNYFSVKCKVFSKTNKFMTLIWIYYVKIKKNYIIHVKTQSCNNRQNFKIKIKLKID